ncbi:hypothetical protein GJ698_13305 [Pseudoduganella sp. FT26W]|jgi:hypothetical protein|uniref:Uncharacterized protein n=1 Tax=Duganella aquatilis TaxID=2666082 RepID=A0A844DC19_9BURK|nr:hypothetical protein [Duganella aquatilis]MRW85059.1 hypothetical protein [Duganella aquatilis]
MSPKFKNSFLILQKLHQLSGGVAEHHYADIFEVGRELRMNELATLDTFIYLQRERLVKWGTLGGVASITQQGIREIEGAMAGKRTAYFPQDIADTV